MKKIRKALCILIAAMMVVCLCPITAMAEESAIIASGYCGAEGDGKNRIWTLDKNGTLTISGTGAMADCSTDLWQNYSLSIKEIAVPNSDSNCSTDGKFLFTEDGTKIIFGINGEWDEDLVIPDGVKCIGFGAFSGRINFTGIVLPDGLERIESKAFWKGSFSGDLVIPETVNYIGHNIFDIAMVGYEIEKVIFNGNAPEIETDSFPKEKILYYFNGKSGWTNPTYKGYFTRAINPETGKLEPLLDSISGYCGAEGDGSNLKWTLTKDGTLTISGTGAMADYQSRISYTRYDKDNSPWRGFADDIKSLVFEEGITRIGDEAFRAFDNITGTIVLPESLEEIGNGAFWGCTGITGELVIPSGVKYIGENAFSDMGITGVTIKCEASMNGLSLRSKSIKKITVPESNPVYSTDGNILYDKNKTKVILSLDKTGLIDTIPSSVTTIGEYAFAYHNIGTGGDLVIPNCVKEIEDGAFMSVEGYSGSLIIPESVENIVTGAFSFINGISNIKVDSKNNNFKAIGNILCSKDGKKLIFGLNINNGVIRIPEGVEVICEAAFCDGMGFVGKLKIPKTVTEIGENAFGGCYGIEEIYFEGDAPTVVGYKTSMKWPSFPNVTLYYIEGKSGWTSPTWNGYMTAKWNNEEENKPEDIEDTNDKKDDVIYIGINGKDEEKNPNTGAQVPSEFVTGVVLAAVCTGAYIASKKHH